MNTSRFHNAPVPADAEGVTFASSNDSREASI